MAGIEASALPGKGRHSSEAIPGSPCPREFEVRVVAAINHLDSAVGKAGRFGIFQLRLHFRITGSAELFGHGFFAWACNGNPDPSPDEEED